MLAIAAAVFTLHLAIQPVLSGSMRPTFSPGAAIITRSIPTASIRPGDIIVFVPPGESGRYAHRIVTVSGPAKRPVITTKGDANPAADRWHARISDDSVPLVIGSVPGLGRLLVAIHQQGARIWLLAASGLVICVVGTRSILGPPPRPAPVPEAAAG